MPAVNELLCLAQLLDSAVTSVMTFREERVHPGQGKKNERQQKLDASNIQQNPVNRLRVFAPDNIERWVSETGFLFI
jgi:hypothetical protein